MLKRSIYITTPQKLRLKNNQLILTSMETGEINSIPIEDLGFVILEHPQISLSLPMLSALSHNNVAVIFCDEQHMPDAMLTSLSNNNLQNVVFKNQINASLPLKKRLWKQTIERKILNQSRLLKKLEMPYEDIFLLSKDVKSDDITNREGQAARLYWKRLMGDHFIRDRFGDYPNALLNYGYILLRAAMARSLIGSGLLATLGIHHHNKYNAFCLADDVMEPYRPYVDELVYEICQKFKPIDELKKEHKMELLQILTTDVLIGKNKRPLMVALSQTTASLTECYSEKSKEIIYPNFK
ncbi:MAG: type II CRISPR-associated endonuclease Cas1 [Bacteroidaceae bacterium]|nr:type II CRISPR-associated endonuclease Cas1 [Bacteroidaceae bacterium]